MTLPIPLPIPLIDHVIINARDGLDDCAGLWSRLGFQLTPRGHHTLGSSNNLAILGNDYIELLGIMPGSAKRTDVLEFPPGLTGIALKTTGSDALFATLTQAGVPVLPPQAFSRPVDRGDGTTGDAAFRTVRLQPGTMPGGRMFFCDHLTPGLVWYDPWRRHRNGATGLATIVIAADDPAPTGTLFGQMFGADSVRITPGGITLTAGLARIEVQSCADVRMRFGAAAPDLAAPGGTMAALVVRTNSLAQAAAALRDGGIAAHSGANQLIVAAADAGGVTLVFEE